MSIRKRARAAAVPHTPADVANIVTANPYIQRLIEDADLRESVRTVLDASRSAYGRLSNGKAPTKLLLDDKKLHHDLRTAIDAIRDATMSLSEAPKKQGRRRRRLTFGRTVALVGVGSGVALAGSEKLRSKVLDALFGAEEEFEYSPAPAASPAPATPSPAPAA
jgi:hypothetical protein